MAISFKTPIPTSDYTINITTAGGIMITFTNTIHYQNFKNYIQCGKYPLVCFENDIYHIFIGNYVLSDTENAIRSIFFLNSDAWGTPITNKQIPLYFVVD